jgi:Peptidase family M28
MMRYLLLGLVLFPAPALAQRAPTVPPPLLTTIADQVSEERLRATVERLVAFGTRHTLSSQTDPHRGIGAALTWAAGEFQAISGACGGCLTMAMPEEMVTAPPRIPNATRLRDVIAIQRGTTDPNRVIIITGHIDSRVTDVMNATSDAPGANDDGSGTAAVIEAARVLSHYRFPATIVYAALSGEEQGLHGGRILANYAKAQGWQVEADLNNDIIGNSCGSDGLCDDDHVRVISEGVRRDATPELIAQQRSLGGENDSPSRNLSRYVSTLAENLGVNLEVRQIWRTDRYGRGGDHIPFQELGFPAIRFTVAIENYDQQHQDLRTQNGVQYGDTIDKMDFPYLGRVAALNVATIAALARAPMPPEPRVEGAVSNDTALSWGQVPGAASYILHWRRTDAPQWEHSFEILGDCGILPNGEPAPPSVAADGSAAPPKCHYELRGTRVDDWVFGVSSVGSDAAEGPVASAVPGGAFRPLPPPPPPAPNN